jgi:ketosteroid isomerase-like protein
MTSERQLAEFMDRFAIREQIDRYIDLLNHRDWDRYEDTMTEDFVWTASAPVNQRIESRAAMMEMVRTVQQYQFGFVFQMGHGVVIDLIDGDRARSHHTLHIVSDHMCYLGIYYDELRRCADGIWRFRRRDFQVTWFDDKPLPGKLFRVLPDPGYRQLPRP